MSDRCAVLILIDGLRCDALTTAKAPHLNSLASRGASSLRALAVKPSITLPCLTSLFYGVGPATHGVLTNRWAPLPEGIPSLVDVLHDGGFGTLMYYNWEELRDMSAPGSVDEAHLINYKTMHGSGSERLLFEMAGNRLRERSFGFTFLYHGALDVVGHASGWMSRAYMECLEDADAIVGGLLGKLPAGCLVVVTSDHGGHDHTHGTNRPEDMTIPLLVAGPGIRGGVTIDQSTSLLDVAPTIVEWFGVQLPSRWQGSPVLSTRESPTTSRSHAAGG